MAEERVQRRLAAILAADVVGYSRLMGEDEVGTLSLLKAIRRGAEPAYVGFTPSFGHSGSGVARHAILATNAPNVRFLPIA
ncbi:MAG: hypothetical protein O7G13_04940, partial [Alphaproteobacteria bacterium]|nr:hypothetical protein [Alphaproteobacteria bacterium]